VTDLVNIEDATVPILSMKFQGVYDYISFAKLAEESVDEDCDSLLEDDATLIEADIWSVRSLNGYRVSNMILKQVPSVEKFREFLRFIRYWAHRRGVSGKFMYTLVVLIQHYSVLLSVKDILLQR
jgi:poly(A) polymerase